MEIEAEVAVGLRDLSPPPSPPMEMFMTPSIRTDPNNVWLCKICVTYKVFRDSYGAPKVNLNHANQSKAIQDPVISFLKLLLNHLNIKKPN